MLKIFNINLFTLLVLVILAGCGSKADPEANASPPVGNADPDALTLSALEKQEIGAFQEAIELLNRALEIDSKFVPAHYRTGSVYEEWDKRKEAIDAYTRTLEIKPDHVKALLGLGSVYSKSNENELAAEKFKKVAELRPGDPEIYFKIALEYWYIQQFPETAAHYRKVIDLDPNHMQAHLNLASVYEGMKEWDKAIEEIEIALRLGRETRNEQAISIAENKLTFFKGRRNLTKEEFKRKTEPPFE